MDLYRESNIKLILKAIEEDKYSEAVQYKEIDQRSVLTEVHEFLSLYSKGDRILEIGCGHGALLNQYGINYAVEPSQKRYDNAKLKLPEGQVKQNVAECLEFEDRYFQTVIMLNGFFQVRSDYETLIEINRVLSKGGSFIFNILTNDKIDAVLGRILGGNNTIRILGQFGFELVAKLKYNAGQRFVGGEQESIIICAEKVREFDYRYLNLPQVKEPGKNIINYLPERDWRLI